MNTGTEHHKQREAPPQPQDAGAIEPALGFDAGPHELTGVPANDGAAALVERQFEERRANTTTKLDAIYDDQMSKRSPFTDEFAFFRQAVQMLGAAFGNDFTSRLLFQLQNMVAVQDSQDEHEREMAEQYDEMFARQERRKEEDKKRDDEADAYQDAIEREEERREYEQSQHGFIGREMTGGEWGELSDKISNDQASRQWLIALMLRDGKNKGEAERDADIIALAFKGMSKREADRTAEEKKAMKQVEEDPQLKKEAQAVADYASTDHGKKITAGRDTAALTDTGRTQSVTGRSNILSGDFPTAPDLSAHHSRALAATEPLDVKMPKQVAAIAPSAMPAASAGLDA